MTKIQIYTKKFPTNLPFLEAHYYTPENIAVQHIRFEFFLES